MDVPLPVRADQSVTHGAYGRPFPWKLLNSMDTILFIICAIISVVCAFNLVLQKHPITSALSLIGVMASLAVLYLLLGAEFMAMAQMIVYGGAVMVLFIFTIMLLNAGAEKASSKSWFAQITGVPLVLAFIALLGFLIKTG